MTDPTDAQNIVNDIDAVLSEHYFTDAMNGVFQALDDETRYLNRQVTLDNPSQVDASTWTYWNGNATMVLRNVHLAGTCRGNVCTLHRPTRHHMRRWPMSFRNDMDLFERLCIHGIGHPDPDSLSDDGIHGCDGCCWEFTFELEANQ